MQAAKICRENMTSFVKGETPVSVPSVTAQKTETAWQELALEIAGIGVWEWDFVAGKGQWSPGLCALLGLSEYDTVISPDGLLQFVHPDDQNKYRHSIYGCIEGLSDHNVEYRVVLPEGSIRWFLDRARIVRDENGGAVKMLGAITDVSERKHEEIARREMERGISGRLAAERALLETEHRFKAILDYAPVAVYIKNLEGKLTFVNQRFLDLFKTTIEEVILQDRSLVHSPEITAQLREHDRLVIQAGRALQFEELIEVDGEQQTYLSVKFPLLDSDGNPYALCGISADITDRKSAERALHERSEALQNAIDEINQLTYSVSHEMGSPLRGIIGNARFLREELDENVEPGVEKRLQRMEHAALKMSRLMDDLLAYSRLGRQEMLVEEVNVSEMAEHIVANMKRDKPEYRQSIVEIEDDICINADPELISTALISLFDNAFKFRKPGSVARIKMRKIDGGFSVADEGIGIDPEYAHKIFLPFERLYRDNDYPGTGIGLAKVHRIVERHGGKVWFASALDEGSKFYLKFSS